MALLEKLEPKNVFHFFEEISKIPRSSGDTKAISDYCVAFAKVRGLYVRQDKINNVIIKKPATFGRENHKGVIIQGHLDMVAEKRITSNHDFDKDGLDLYVEDGYLKAKDTTLGGDDGIAIAYALALLDSDNISHPNLEVIFTIDEETGMDGAKAIDLSDINSKYLLNIDSEEEGVFVAGCAGGAKVKCNIPYRTVIKEGLKCTLFVEGLKGGHSGVEIDKERGNADIIAARVLSQILKTINIDCIEICGGNKDNAIPRECLINFLVDSKQIEKLKIIIFEIEKVLKKEYTSSDSGIKLGLFVGNSETHSVIIDEDLKNILFYLNNIPNGIMHMNYDIKGLVETSLNLGILNTKDNHMTAVSAVRSSVSTRRKMIIDKLDDFAQKCGGFIEVHGSYPEWEYKKDSELRQVMIDTYKELYNKEPVIDIIHAGLECGYLLEKKPDLDAVSFGPDIFDIHTTEEKMSIESVERVYKFLIEVLKNIK